MLCHEASSSSIVQMNKLFYFKEKKKTKAEICSIERVGHFNVNILPWKSFIVKWQQLKFKKKKKILM